MTEYCSAVREDQTVHPPTDTSAHEEEKENQTVLTIFKFLLETNHKICLLPLAFLLHKVIIC